VFLTPDYLCIAMEYVPGGELYRHVTQSDLRRLPEDKARYFFRQLLAGLEYCHTLVGWGGLWRCGCHV
jgi:serine/threonine-protein kinase SRK2